MTGAYDKGWCILDPLSAGLCTEATEMKEIRRLKDHWNSNIQFDQWEKEKTELEQGKI